MRLDRFKHHIGNAASIGVVIRWVSMGLQDGPFGETEFLLVSRRMEEHFVDGLIFERMRFPPTPRQNALHSFFRDTEAHAVVSVNVGEFSAPRKRHQRIMVGSHDTLVQPRRSSWRH